MKNRKYYEKNKSSFEEVQKRFRYLKLSPEILIGNKIVNEEYFNKIDLFENSILDGVDFENLTSNYKNDVKNISFVNSEGIKNNGEKLKDIETDTFKKFFLISEILSPKFINDKDDYYLVELLESKTEMLNLNSRGLKTKIINQIKLISQIEKISKLINDIEENKFSIKDFENLAIKNNQKIENVTLKNVNDSGKFNSNSLKRIYEYKKGSIFVLPDEKENFLVAIVNEKNPKIDINSKKYKDYVKKTKELYVAKIYKSYDRYINQSYKIDIKANVLKRIENSF